MFCCKEHLISLQVELNRSSPHLDLVVGSFFKHSHHAAGIRRWEIRNAWEQKKKKTCSFIPPPSVLKTGRVGLYQLLEKPPLWESLSSANGRQTPQRAVEIAWKRLKRDPDSVVSLAFHCGWQIQEGDLANENTEETRDANEDKQPHPKVQLATDSDMTGDGRMVVNGAIVLKQSLLFYFIKYSKNNASNFWWKKKKKQNQSCLFVLWMWRDGSTWKRDSVLSYHELFVTFQQVGIYFPREKKKSFKLCWTLNDNHAISLKGFLWHFYVSINVNKASEIHSRGPCVVSWHCLLATSCPFMSSVLAELSPSCFLSLSVSICRFAQTHSNKKSFFFLPTPPKSLL